MSPQSPCAVETQHIQPHGHGTEGTGIKTHLILSLILHSDTYTHTLVTRELLDYVTDTGRMRVCVGVWMWEGGR